MKVALYFKLPEEQPEYETAMKGINYNIAIERIRNEVFRPHRKHGYDMPLLDSDKAHDIIAELETRFFAILSDEDAL